jgi:hypothetical protein
LDPILIQAAIAAALSFAHLHDIAEAAGQGGWKAWAYPVSVDLLMVMAWRRMRAKDDRPKGGPWFWFLLALVGSLPANVATAGVLDLAHPPTWLRVLVAGWPALAFLGGSLLAHTRNAVGAATNVDNGSGESSSTSTGALTAAESHEEAPGTPQEPVSGPPEVPADEETQSRPREAYTPVLVSYRDAAEALDVNEVTVRGWANNGTVVKYDGPTPNTRRVDLLECERIRNGRVAAVA